jgi:HK97 family phage major capsid protein
MDMSEIKALLEAQGTQVKAAMEKYEGQLQTGVTVATEAKDAVKSLSDDFAKLLGKYQSLSQEMADGLKNMRPTATKSAAQEFVESEKFKAFVAANGEIGKIRLELTENLTSVKSTTLGGSTTVFPQQMPGVIPGGFVPLTVRAALRTIPVGQTNQINSLREASWTNSAAEASEGTSKLESDITFENYDVPIRTIAHWLKVSNQLLADAPAIVAYIETRLRDGLAQRVERQVIAGNGTSPNISGLTDSGNYTAYTSTSTDTLTDAINRAKYTLWAAGFPPDLVIVNPADWGSMERLRESGSSGAYLYGVPGMNAGMNPFGVRVVLSTYVSAGYFIIGAFNPTVVLYERQGAVVEMGYDGNDFTKNLVTLRAEERLGLGIERPTAILYGQFDA